MSKPNDSSPFWVSYGDLMTSLFFVMLILFVLCIAQIQKERIAQQDLALEIDQVKTTNKQLQRIVQLDEQFKELNNASDLEYIEEKKVFVAKDLIGVEIFTPFDATIKPEYLDTVDRVGESLLEVLKALYKNNPQLSFQLIIEGNAAIPWHNLRQRSFNPDNTEMYRLSYDRALALYLRWQSRGIDLRAYNTEVIIAGSGFNGLHRDQQVEENNKRFIIQIIPKVSKPQT